MHDWPAENFDQRATRYAGPMQVVSCSGRSLDHSQQRRLRLEPARFSALCPHQCEGRWMALRGGDCKGGDSRRDGAHVGW